MVECHFQTLFFWPRNDKNVLQVEYLGQHCIAFNNSMYLTIDRSKIYGAAFWIQTFTHVLKITYYVYTVDVKIESECILL